MLASSSPPDSRNLSTLSGRRACSWRSSMNPRQPQIRVLLVEDDTRDAELVLRELKRAGLNPDGRQVQTEADFRQAIAQFRPQIILSDFSMPQFDGMQALTLARELCPDTPLLFVSGTLGEEYAIG